MMKKLPLFSLVFVISFSSGWAQTGFKSKAKPTASGRLPTFEFQEVPIPAARPNNNPGLLAQNSTPSLRTALRFRVVRDADGSVIWLEDQRPTGQIIDPQSRQSASSVAFQFLEKTKGLLGIARPAEEFELLETTADSLRQTHLKLRQMYRGVPVYGGEIMLHSRNDTLRLLNGRSFPTPTLTDLRPALDQTRAIDLAMRHLGKKAIVRPVGEGLAARFGRPKHELVIYRPANRGVDQYLPRRQRPVPDRRHAGHVQPQHLQNARRSRGRTLDDRRQQYDGRRFQDKASDEYQWHQLEHHGRFGALQRGHRLRLLRQNLPAQLAEWQRRHGDFGRQHGRPR